MTATRLTYASCWLARIAMPKPYSEYMKQLVVPGPQIGRYIANIAGGENHGKLKRNRQVLSEIY